MKMIEYADREMLTMNVAHALAGELRNCLLSHDSVSFAVPGGTTPGPIFDLMQGADLDWSRVHVLLTDERWVDEDNSHSNAGLVRARLLTGPAGRARFIPFYRQGMTAKAGAAAAAEALQDELPLSLLLLGMGADMHTASLFPGAPGLAEALAETAPLLCPVRPAGQDMDRVTLPAHVLRGAMATHLVIFGDDKRAAVERAQSLPPEEAPVSVVLNTATVHWAA